VLLRNVASLYLLFPSSHDTAGSFSEIARGGIERQTLGLLFRRKARGLVKVIVKPLSVEWSAYLFIF